MGFDPQRFFIGVIDLFSVILPGMIATFVLDAAWGEDLLGDAYADLSGASAVVAFLVASYLLGHFIFLLGAGFLDSLFYGPLRERARVRTERFVGGTRTLTQRVADWPFDDTTYDDRALEHVRQLKAASLGTSGAQETMNAFQWSKARLLLEQPSALAKVERFEADSKFFRSLCVLFVLMLPVLGVVGRWDLFLVVLPLVPLAFWRYVDQRLKSITHAYWYVTLLDAGS
jgi:hypothetical protein